MLYITYITVPRRGERHNCPSLSEGPKGPRCLWGRYICLSLPAPKGAVCAMRIVGFGPSPLGTERKQSGTKALWAYIAFAPSGQRVAGQRASRFLVTPKGRKAARSFRPFGGTEKRPEAFAPSGGQRCGPKLSPLRGDREAARRPFGFQPFGHILRRLATQERRGTTIYAQRAFRPL